MRSATCFFTVAAGVVSLVPAGVHAQRLMALEGIELRGSARVVTYGAATCQVREGFAGDDKAYDPANRGQPLDVWQLDFSVYNGSGKWLDHLIARYNIESEWPPCSSWDGPEAGTVEGVVRWAGHLGFIQETGRNVVAPGEALKETVYLAVFHSDPPPYFERWSLDYNFASSPPAGRGDRSESTHQTAGALSEESLFWQSIMNSSNPAEFEAYLTQFPNGVFRRLADLRLGELRALEESVAGAPGPGRSGHVTDSPRPAENPPDEARRDPDGTGLPAPRQAIDFGDDTGEWPRDGECDDPRFDGPGMGVTHPNAPRGRDATDCRQLLESGRVYLVGAEVERLGTADPAADDHASTQGVNEESARPSAAPAFSQDTNCLGGRQTADGGRRHASCYQEIEERPGCYVYTLNLSPDQKTMSWSGECVDSFAEGIGTLVRTYTQSGIEKVQETSRGSLRLGKRNGPWIVRTCPLGAACDPEVEQLPGVSEGEHSGWGGEGSFVDGHQTGTWRTCQGWRAGELSVKTCTPTDDTHRFPCDLGEWVSVSEWKCSPSEAQ